MSTFFTLEDSIYIANNGNVGIGVTNPTNNLHVVGDINSTTSLKINNTTVLGATTLGSSVVNSSLTSVGTLASLTVTGATTVVSGHTSLKTCTLERANSITEGGELTLKMSDDTNVWSIDCYGSSTTQQDLRIFSSASGNTVKIASDLEVTGSMTQGATSLKGSIIPDVDNAYDIGSASYKIRDMYVSDNSLWVGDNHKVSISGGKMKFRKRKTSSVPAAITAAGGNASGALTHSGRGSISTMKLKHWKAYMRTLANQSSATIQDIFRDNTDDYDQEASVDNWLESGSKTYNTLGNVGIGTSDPSALLSLHYIPESSQGLKELLRLSWDDGNYDTLKGDGTKISFNTSNTNNFPGGEEGGNIGVMKANAVEADTECDFTLGLNNGTSVVERMRILSDGNVGIGDSTPSYKLDVAGDINLTGDLRVNGVAQSFGGGSSTWSLNGVKAYYNGGNVGIGTNSPANMFHIHKASSTSTILQLTNSNTGSGASDGFKIQLGTWGDFHFMQQEDADTAFWTNGSERMRILNTGYIGINMVNPAYHLDVTGDINLTGDLRVNGVAQSFGGGSSTWSLNGTNAYYNGGNVGIGTDNPSQKLDVNGNSIIGSTSGTYNERLLIGDVFGNNWAGIVHNDLGKSSNFALMQNRNGRTVLNASSAEYIGFNINNVEKMRISNTGNVGIGDSTPSYKLDVAGDINLTGDLRIDGVVQSFGGGSVTGITSVNANSADSLSGNNSWWPPQYMTTDTETLNDGIDEQDGSYVVTTSSVQGGNNGYRAFNDAVSGNTAWFSLVNTYGASNGIYAGSENLTSDYVGEWLKVKMPRKVKITQYKIGNMSSSYKKRSPIHFRLVGSNDDSSWTTINSQTLSDSNSWTSGPISKTYNVTPSVSYQYYAVIVQKCGGYGPMNTGREMCMIGYLSFYGQGLMAGSSVPQIGINDTTPSYALDVTGDINLTGDLRVNGVAQSFGGGSSGHTGNDGFSGAVVAFNAERNGSVNTSSGNHNKQLAWGNGSNATHGVTMPKAGKVIGMTFSATSNSSCKLHLTSNNANTAYNIATTANYATKTEDMTTFIAGQRIGLKLQIVSGTTSYITGSFFVVFD